MMRHKRYLLVALAALAVAGTVAVPGPRPRFTLADYERVRLGMTKGELEAVLGKSGDYTTGPKVFFHYGYRSEGELPDTEGPQWAEHWEADQGTVMVQFDAASRCRIKTFIPTTRQEQGTLENVQWRLERAWKRLAR
jgi:hypothetical protein